jgi:NTE family protein
MASSCVPFAFTPVTIDRQYFANTKDYDRIHPQLVDGGVYDNQGIQKITQPKSFYNCDIIITSDAGGTFMADKKYPNVIALLIRTMDLFMYRIKSSQMVQNVYRNAEGAAKPIAYYSLGWRIQHLIPGFIDNMEEGTVLKEVMEAHELLPEWIESPEKYRTAITEHLERRIGYCNVLKKDLDEDQWKLARNTGTNLTGLSGKRIEYLIRHAENLTELQVKLYCPSLIFNHA